MDAPVTSDPIDRRRWGHVLLFAALGLFLAGLALPLDNGGRVRGYKGVGELVEVTATRFDLSAISFARAAIIAAILQAFLAATLLMAGYRTGGRVAACLVAALAWGVSGYLAFRSRDLVGDLSDLLTNATGTLAWFACVAALVAAAFVWPRGPGVNPES